MPEQQPTEGTAAAPADAERQEHARRRTRMVAAGFYDAAKSERWLDSPELAQVNTDALFAGLRWAPSPDIALPSLVRLIEKHPATAERANRGDAEFSMFRLLGSSQALGDFLYRNPHLIDQVLDSHGLDSEPELIATQEPSTIQAEDIEPQIDPHDVEETPHIRGYSGTAGGKKLDDIDEPTAPLATAYRTDLLEAVGANPDDERPRASREMTGKDGYTALRVAYRAALTKIALVDVCSPDPVELMPTVGRHLADLAAAALEGALAIARTEVAEGLGGGLCSAPARGASVDALDLAIIGMGKCGARELNYISDVDVVYVIAPVPASELPEGVEPLTEQDCAQIGTELVHALTKAIMAPASEPPLWEVDANLRPEGKDGPLVRTVESYVRYYKRWAENWEFQALLKARPYSCRPAGTSNKARPRRSA